MKHAAADAAADPQEHAVRCDREAMSREGEAL